MKYKAATFLIVDDDKVSVFALQRMMKRLKLVNPVVTASDGLEALRILRGDGERSPLETPYIVILDLNMPRMDGFEFLEAAQKLVALPVLPPVLVMLATPLGPFHSDQARKFDVIKGYLDKPLSADDLTSAIRSL